jgi:hypothetical protein
MQFVILAVIVAVMGLQYMVYLGWLPSLFNYLPEILALVACAAVVLVGVQTRFRYVRPIYWLVFSALALVTVCGAVVNSLEPGPMFAGIRTYLRAVPFFFLPAVLLFTERQVRTQLLVLLAFCAVQAPLAWAQRLGPLSNEYTGGDSVIGSVMDSGILSMFLIGAACVLTACYLRRRISFLPYLVLLLLCLAPTTMNETKVTLVMLPVALMVTFYAGSARGTRLKNMLLGLILIAGFLAVFIPIYDYFIAPKWGYGILDFLTMEGRVERYLTTGAEVGVQEGVGRAPGRLDGVFVAFSELSKDPTQLVFGYGIGNASDSALGAQFSGAYLETFAPFPATTLTVLLLELGVLGLALVLFLHWLIFLDSLAIARRDPGILGAVAMGWTGVTAVLIIGFPYVGIVTFPAMSYLFWYFSGLLAAARMRSAVSAEIPHGSRSVQPGVLARGRYGPLPDVRPRPGRP